MHIYIYIHIQYTKMKIKPESSDLIKSLDFHVIQVDSTINN